MTEASTTAPAGSPAPSPAACDGPDTGTPEGDGPEGEDFLAARTRREVAEAHLAELKLAEQQGAVIQIEAVRAIWSRRVASTRDALLQIPSRLAPVVAAESNLDKVAELMETEIRQALAELSRVDA